MKIHLCAKVPNEGARRLAWIIGTECRGNTGWFAWRAGMDAGQVQRLLDGDVIPGEELCERIGQATADRIRRLDWQNKPLGGWFDEPAARVARDFSVRAA